MSLSHKVKSKVGVKCQCGQLLHYKDIELKTIVEEINAQFGEYTVVLRGGKKYRVQRHYVALHGIKGLGSYDLDALGFRSE